MNEPEILDSDIRALQQWLRTAWKQLGDPSLTAFARRELRNQMKQCSADLREQLQRMARSNSRSRPRCRPRTIPSLICEFWPGEATVRR